MLVHLLRAAALAIFSLGGGAVSIFPALAVEPYTINVVLPLTGNASFLGKGEQDAFQILERMVNEEGGIQGRPLRFEYHDDQSNPQVAVQLANRIIAAKPPVILGSGLVAMCNAMSPLVQGAGPVMFCLSPGVYPKPGGYVFTSNVSVSEQAKSLLRHLRMKGMTRIAMIFTTDATGQDAEKGFRAALAEPENAEMRVPEIMHFNPSDMSVTAQIEMMKKTDPQAVIAWSTGSPISTVFKGLIQAGLDVPVITTYGNMTYQQMTQYASFLPKRLLMPSPAWLVEEDEDPFVAEAKKKFHAAFRKAGIAPDFAATLAWEPGLLVINSLRKLGTDVEPKKLRDHFLNLQGQPGIYGTYDFIKTPQRGLDEQSSLVTEWSPSKKTWVLISKPFGIPN